MTSARVTGGRGPDLIVAAFDFADCVKSREGMKPVTVRQRPRGALYLYPAKRP